MDGQKKYPNKSRTPKIHLCLDYLSRVTTVFLILGGGREYVYLPPSLSQAERETVNEKTMLQVVFFMTHLQTYNSPRLFLQQPQEKKAEQILTNAQHVFQLHGWLFNP